MKLSDMKNIGPKMERKLNCIGIECAEDLTGLGSKATFFRLKRAFPDVGLIHLYLLHGAINNIDISKLPKDVKDDLKSYNDNFLA
jgi:hypothetical protein